MRYRLPITAAAALMMSGFGATAAELPSYEVMGFPITPHQLVTLGPANAEQGLPTVGKPAAVLMPRQAVIDGQIASSGRAGAALAQLSPLVTQPAR